LILHRVRLYVAAVSAVEESSLGTAHV